MRITTGLEVLIERVDNDSYKNNIQDAIVYIELLESKLDKIKELTLDVAKKSRYNDMEDLYNVNDEILNILGDE